MNLCVRELKLSDQIFDAGGHPLASEHMAECMDAVDNLGDVFLVIKIRQLKNENLNGQKKVCLVSLYMSHPSEWDRKRSRCSIVPLVVWHFSLL